MRALLLLVALLAGCCPAGARRGITPDWCALQSEAVCRRECAELGQRFAAFMRGGFCVCARYADGAFEGSAVGGPLPAVEEAWAAWRRGAR